MSSSKGRYVGRAGEKLQGALTHFGIDVANMIVADLGCNIGGFTDCLLSHGASKVYAVDTGYGMFDYGLRGDERVVLMERTNALHLRKLPEDIHGVVVDVGWTRQELIIPSAMRLLVPGGWIVSLLKPHYESGKRDLVRGVLPQEKAGDVLRRVIADIEMMGIKVDGNCDSPLLGDSGNREYFIKIIKPE